MFYFSEVHVENFQGFKGVQTAELSPVTLIFGPNASGKSSVFRALRLLAGTWFANKPIFGDESAKFDYIDDESTGEVTSFENAHFGHQIEGVLGVGVRLKRDIASASLDSEIPGISEIFFSIAEIRPIIGFFEQPEPFDGEITSQLELRTDLGDSLTFNCVLSSKTAFAEWRVETDDDEVDRLFKYLEDYPYYWPDPRGLDTTLDDGPIRISFQSQETELTDSWSGLLSALVSAEATFEGHYGTRIFPNFDEAINDIDLRGDEPGPIDLGKAVESRLKELESSDKAEAESLRLLLDLVANSPVPIEISLIPKVVGVNPYALKSTKRTTSQSLFIAKLLKGTEKVLSEAFKEISHTEPIRPRRGEVVAKSTIEYSDELNELLGALTDGRYEVHRDSNSTRLRNEKRPMVHDTLTGARIPFEHVGTGISQVLPILNELAMVQLRFDAGDNYEGGRCAAPVHLIEQPELHLHPKLQSSLAELVIVWSKNHQIQVIMETHSESILLRAQKLVRKGIIGRSDLAICYVDSFTFDDVPIFRKTRGSNVISNINIAGNGDILDPFPNSFVDMRIADWLG